MMAAFCDRVPCLVAVPAALARSMSARVRPAPKAPIWRKLRRLTPSQKPCGEPRNRSMDGLLKRGTVGKGVCRRVGASRAGAAEVAGGGWDVGDIGPRH